MGSKRRQYSRKKKTIKFKGNQHQNKNIATPPQASSASSIKLSNISVSIPDSVSEGQMFIMDIDCLNILFKMVHCPVCCNPTISVADIPSKRMGCSLALKIKCSNYECSFDSDSCYSSKKREHFFEVNRRVVYGMRQIGCGYEDACTFFSTMNMPPPPQRNAFNAHTKELLKVVERLGEEVMMGAAIRVRQKNNSDECGVSVDGSWHRRGYSSLNGVVTTLSIDSGEVLDVEVLTKDCVGCRKWGNVSKTNPKYISWLANHVCDVNYTGSSSGMETVGVGRIFLRSNLKRGLKYTQFYGDGDSKSFHTVHDLEPYPGTSIVKKECVGHYQKRLGTALRKLKSKNKGIGGKGNLTFAKINKMQNYFGIALRNNTDSVEHMSKAIWASYYHLCSQDSHPLHSKCPIGNKSWCSYQRAVANKKTFKHKGGLPMKIMKVVKPIYTRLTSPDMLEKCLHGKTQNCNESLHALIWKRCPKTTFAGINVVKLSVYDAVIHFNSGAEPQLELMKRMGICPGQYMVEGIKKKDNLRIKASLRLSTPNKKQRRRYIKGQKKKREDDTVKSEGPTYEAGGF